MNKFFQIIKRKKLVALICIIIFIYLAFFLYFQNHFLFRTHIYGINVSCMNIDKANINIESNINHFSLEIQERNNLIENINGEDINLNYNKKEDKLETILKEQNKFLWFTSIFKSENNEDLECLEYNDKKLDTIINNLNALNNSDIISPQNPKLIYNDGIYIIQDEIYGNKLKEDEFKKCIKQAVLSGEKIINLDSMDLYEKPKYYSNSKEVVQALEIINSYINTKIVYDFEHDTETLDKDIINEWLSANDEMKIIIDENKVKDYVKNLAAKYNTLGTERNFKTSSGKNIKIKGGNYGFKINIDKETKDIINSIEKGQQLFKQPCYSQKSICRNEENDIGDTYVEVNITRQMLWFYKNGKLVISGDVVTGNVSRGNPTHLGIYELNYKQNNATLKGFGYSSKVKYWMPFDGNIGLHDASWRGAFGGSIYKSEGTHGCVNLPIYLAKKIYEEIDAGTPIIVYTEE